MSKDEIYPKWLGRNIYRILRGLKDALLDLITDIPTLIRKPYTAITVGAYTIIAGIVGLLINIVSYNPSYPPSFFGLTTPQLGLLTLAGFILLTHGIYRAERR